MGSNPKAVEPRTVWAANITSVIPNTDTNDESLTLPIS